MRRRLLAAAALAGLAVTAARAEYILIRVYVGGRPPEEAKPNNNQNNRGPGFGGPGGGPGGPPPPPGGPGGGPGAGGGLGGGGGGPPPPPGGPDGGPGAGGGLGGGPGAGGGLGGPGGGPGGPGGGPMGGGPGGGPMGGFGGGRGPMGGFGGGRGPMGGGNFGPMGGGNFGPGGGNLAGSVEFETSESYVMVAVELLDKIPQQNDVLNIKQHRHPFGKTAFYQDGTNILTTMVDQKSPRKEYAEQRTKLSLKKDRSTDDYVVLAEWALARGLINECATTLDEMVKSPLPGVNAASKAALAAYEKIRDQLASAMSVGTSVEHWKQKLSNYTPFSSEHYVLFYGGQSATTPAEVTRRLNLLEQNMKAYYLWFALKGIVLPMPEEKLVAIMVSDTSAFKAQRTALDMPPGVSDGFFAARDNVAVFSPQRLDEAYQIFDKWMQSSVWVKGWSREPLLAGKDIPREMKTNKNGNWRDEFRRVQTLALVDRALEHEAELASVTHEGTRQLAIATKLYPRTAAVPEWISFGFASLFDTPKGPYPGSIGACKVAFWPVYGGPNWAYIRPFQIWARSADALTRLDEPAVALRRTITDTYFQNSRKEIKEEVDSSLTESERQKKEREIARSKEELLRARTQSWALAYYLAKSKMQDLLAYFQVLSEMPRDLEMDDKNMELTFARAFKLTNAAGDAIDDTKFTAFAKDWFDTINRVSRPGADLTLSTRQAVNSGSNNGGQGPGGGPGGGGPPGPPGGGPGGPGGPPNPPGGGGRP